MCRGNGPGPGDDESLIGWPHRGGLSHQDGETVGAQGLVDVAILVPRIGDRAHVRDRVTGFVRYCLGESLIGFLTR